MRKSQSCFYEVNHYIQAPTVSAQTSFFSYLKRNHIFANISSKVVCFKKPISYISSYLQYPSDLVSSLPNYDLISTVISA